MEYSLNNRGSRFAERQERNRVRIEAENAFDFALRQEEISAAIAKLLGYDLVGRTPLSRVSRQEMRDAVIAKAISDYEKRKRQEEISAAIEGLGDSGAKIDYPVFQKTNSSEVPTAQTLEIPQEPIVESQEVPQEEESSPFTIAGIQTFVLAMYLSAMARYPRKS